MVIQYSFFDLMFYLLLYSFLGWGIEVCCIAVRDRHFVNRGFLNLPFTLPYGITAVILMEMLPTVRRNLLVQYLLTLTVFCIVWNLAAQFIHNISRKSTILTQRPKDISSRRDLPFALSVSAVFLLWYLIIHPFILGFVTLLPDLLVRILVIGFSVLIAVDYVGVLHALRTNTVSQQTESRQQSTQHLAQKINSGIWDRLQKAYPGIQDADPEEQSKYTFAKGICFDKLVWVFLISSLLGALIEMVYCRAMGDIWMNRSSLLYGSFSVVWGFGAVVLTVVLHRFAGKEDRKIFLAGFLVGGAYEYFCSVFTELLFGTVFWDYSEMPLNIGGRTNVIYCIFWGLLAVMWIKVLYPPMERTIEKLPPLTGKVLTWVIVIVMVCDGLLTAGAMARYTARQTEPEAGNLVEAFLDESYPDEWMEARWRNMVVTGPETE